MEGLLIPFGNNAVSASRESLFLCKNEKDELGFQVIQCKKSKMAIPFFQISKAYREDIKCYVIIFTEICEDLY